MQFKANSSVSDAEKEDRKAMEKKMDEMEEKLQVWTPGRQQIINTITKLGPAIEASLGCGTVQNNIKFHIGVIHNPHSNVYLNNIKQKSKYSSKISF